MPADDGIPTWPEPVASRGMMTAEQFYHKWMDENWGCRSDVPKFKDWFNICEAYAAAQLAKRDKTVVSDWKADLLDTGAEFILINGKRHWVHDAKEIVRLHNAQLAESESANNGENKQGAPTSALASSDPQIEQLRKEKHLAALTIAAQLAQLAEKEREIAKTLLTAQLWKGAAEAAEERLKEAQAQLDALKELLTDMELEHSATLRQREAELEQRWIAVAEKEPPKDGSEVLLLVKYRAGIPNGKLVGHWQPGGHCIQDHPPIEAGWYFWNGRMFDKSSEPTHWQPLPSPPKVQP